MAFTITLSESNRMEADYTYTLCCVFNAFELPNKLTRTNPSHFDTFPSFHCVAILWLMNWYWYLSYIAVYYWRTSSVFEIYDLRARDSTITCAGWVSEAWGVKDCRKNWRLLLLIVFLFIRMYEALHCFTLLFSTSVTKFTHWKANIYPRE